MATVPSESKADGKSAGSGRGGGGGGLRVQGGTGALGLGVLGYGVLMGLKVYVVLGALVPILRVQIWGLARLPVAFFVDNQI